MTDETLDYLKCLKQVFNYDCFRHLQKEIIDDMVKGNDMIILMPTGAGKSLCYQLPAIVQGGLTVIISPLISLIYDQISDLKKNNVLAHYLCTGAKISIYDIFKDVINNKCNMLYTTPETFNNNIFLNEQLSLLNEKGLLRRFIVDEVHCLSNWGHDFRSEYLKLNMRGKFANIPICGFTATATKLVQADIIDRLELKEPLLWMTSYIKENISYRIEQKEQDSWSYINNKVLKFIKNSNNATGIVYCLSRKQCEHISQYLCNNNINAAYYHAAMPPDEKNLVQENWLKGSIKVIVATIAFALGINKQDVRYVIHTSMPNSIEGYYQQAGRAGRDNKASIALLYYSFKDKEALMGMIDYSLISKESPVSQNDRISEIYNLCENNKDCIKFQLSLYLGETNVSTCIKRRDSAPCKICKDNLKILPVASAAIVKVLSLLKSSKKVNMCDLLKNLNNLEEFRALNYLINNETIKTQVIGTAGKYIEYAWENLIF